MTVPLHVPGTKGKGGNPTADTKVKPDASIKQSAEQSEPAEGDTSVAEEMEHETKDLVDGGDKP